MRLHDHDRTDLIGNRENVVVFGDVDMKHVELVPQAQLVGDARERRAPRLWHTVVYHNEFVCVAR